MLRFRSGRPGRWVAPLVFGSCLTFGTFALAGEGKGGKHKNKPSAPDESASPGAEGLSNVPLPVGHEAKGLVLPDFDADGHLRGRFEAGTAKRVDDQHMRLLDLKMHTFTPENQPDLQVEMSDSLLDLRTRVLNSPHRTTVRRSDFTIVGDRMEFDTVQRKGTMTGNVKMVIINAARLTEKDDE